jgi:hypothetical protein
MIHARVLALLDLLDHPHADGERIRHYLHGLGDADVHVERLTGPNGSTDHLRVTIPGSHGKSRGGDAPTLGIIGRLGGSGARPHQIGHVSDGDGALAALAAAADLIRMRERGDHLPGDVVITTHVTPAAPVRAHRPVPMMGSPIDSAAMNAVEVRPEMDAILSIDTTRGNRVLNHKGIAITATVLNGWILRVADDLLDTLTWVTGRLPVVLPITMQDLTPYGNGVYHVNSILQPAVTARVPVVGVALTAEVAVPGSATGATQIDDAAAAGTFAIEVAKRYGAGDLTFYDPTEYATLLANYGPMERLLGRNDP